MKYIVWIKEDRRWSPNGDGPMGKATAERVAREVRQLCGTGARVLPVGEEPL